MTDREKTAVERIEQRVADVAQTVFSLRAERNRLGVELDACTAHGERVTLENAALALRLRTVETQRDNLSGCNDRQARTICQLMDTIHRLHAEIAELMEPVKITLYRERVNG